MPSFPTLHIRHGALPRADTIGLLSTRRIKYLSIYIYVIMTHIDCTATHHPPAPGSPLVLPASVSRLILSYSVNRNVENTRNNPKAPQTHLQSSRRSLERRKPFSAEALRAVLAAPAPLLLPLRTHTDVLATKSRVGRVCFGRFEVCSGHFGALWVLYALQKLVARRLTFEASTNPRSHSLPQVGRGACQRHAPAHSHAVGQARLEDKTL